MKFNLLESIILVSVSYTHLDVYKRQSQGLHPLEALVEIFGFLIKRHILKIFQVIVSLNLKVKNLHKKSGGCRLIIFNILLRSQRYLHCLLYTSKGKRRHSEASKRKSRTRWRKKKTWRSEGKVWSRARRIQKRNRDIPRRGKRILRKPSQV